MRPRHAAAVVAGVLALFLAGCSTSRPTVQPSGTSTSTLPSTAIKLENGGAVTIAVPYLPTNFNPSSPAGDNRVTDMLMAQVWPQSFVIDPQYQPQTTGFLDDAELVSLSPQTIAYHVDKGARWADGTPIGAADFVYNWHEQIRHAGTSSVAGALAGYEDIASITGSDGGRTVLVRFARTYADWEGLFQNLVPAHVAERIGWDGFDVSHLSDVVSGGPFEIASYVPGFELTLRRNPRWWGTPAHLDSIVLRVVTGGSSATWKALTSEKVEVGEVMPDASGALRATAAGLDSATTLSPVLWQLCFNVTDALLAEPAIRSAIALATGRTELVADTIGLDDPGTPVAQNRVYLSDQPGWSNDGGQYDQADVLDAESLLEAAGYQMSPSGYLERSGQRLVLSVAAPSGFPLTSQLEAVFQAQMKDAGIVVRFRNVPLAQLLGQLLPSSQYQLALVPFIGDPFESWTQDLYNPPGSVPLAGGGAAGATGVTGAGGGGGGAAGAGGGGGGAADAGGGGGGAAAGGGGLGGGGAVGAGGGGAGGAAAGAGGLGGGGAVGAGWGVGGVDGGMSAGAGASSSAGQAAVAGAGGAALSPGAVDGQPVVPGVVASDVSGLSDPAVASLYAEAEGQIDPPAARRLYQEIDGLLWQDLPTLPLFQMPVTLVTSHFLVNVQESPTPVGIMWNAQDWAIALNLPAPTAGAGG